MDKSCGEKCERARKEGLFYVKTKQVRTDHTHLLRFLPDVLGVWWRYWATNGNFSEPCVERGGLPNLRAPPIDLPTPLIASIGDFFEPRPVQTVGLLVGEGCSRERSAPGCGDAPLMRGNASHTEARDVKSEPRRPISHTRGVEHREHGIFPLSALAADGRNRSQAREI